MKLLVPPRVRPSLDLMLLLTLLLVAVCGMPEKPHSLRVLSKKPPIKTEDVVGRGEDQQPEGSARPAPTPVTRSSLNTEGTFRPTFLGGRERSPVLGAVETLSGAELRDTEHDSHTHEEDGAEAESGMRIEELQEPVSAVKVIHDDSDVNTCDKWMSCDNHFFNQFLKFTLKNLPSCPCTYPNEALGGVATLFDKRLGRTFSWEDASEAEEDVAAFHPSSHLCLRSVWSGGSRTLGSQLCCYDGRGRLLTRGQGAGSPELVSPYLSPDLHFILNRDRWISCKGDWSRFQQVLPPNNGLACPEHPSRERYEAQLRALKES